MEKFEEAGLQKLLNIYNPSIKILKLYLFLVIATFLIYYCMAYYNN